MFEQPRLPPQSAAITRQRAVRTDNAVTWNDDGKLVVTVGASYRTHGRLSPDHRRDVRIGTRFTGWNPAQRLPYSALECGTGQLERRVEAERLARKIGVQLTPDGVEMAMLAGNDVLREVATQGLQLALEAPAIDKLEQMQAGIVCQRQHRTERRFKPLRVQAIHGARLAGRRAEYFHEGIAKAAGRFEALIELQVEHVFSLSDSSERKSHSPGTVIGMKAHAAVTLKRPSRRGRVDAHTHQIGFAQSCARLGLHGRQELPHYRRWLGAHIERPAAQAGAIARVQSIMRPRVEFDVFALGRARVTHRAAKNAGGLDADIEDSVEGRVALDERAVHLIGCWQLVHAMDYRQRADAASSKFGRRIPIRN